MSILDSIKTKLTQKITLIIVGIMVVAFVSGFSVAHTIRNVEAANRMPVTVHYQGETSWHFTTANIPWIILDELGFDVSANYIIYPWAYEEIELPAELTLIRTSVGHIHDKFYVPHETFVWENHAMAYGETNVVRYGVDGFRQTLVRFYYHDGVEVNSVVLYDGYITPSVPKIIEVGTRGRPITNRLFRDTPRAQGFTYSRSFVAEATAYDPSIAPGRTPITATGQVARRGIVATDPRVIPMGTRMYITSTDGTWSYGFAVAGDTGGAIRGYKVDLFMCSRAEALQFGRRNVKVYILD